MSPVAGNDKQAELKVKAYTTTSTLPTFSSTASENIFNIIVSATDGSGNTSDQSIAINLLEADAPQITGPNSSTGTTSTINMEDDKAFVFKFTADETVSWSLTGGADQSKFAIDSSSGNLLFINAPEIGDSSSLSASSNNTYSVQVTATDLSGNTTYQDVVINLLAPAIEGALFEDVTSGTSIGKFVKIKLSHAIDTTASSITDFRNNLTLFDYSDADNRNDLIASDADISFSGNEISIKLTGLTADDSSDISLL